MNVLVDKQKIDILANAISDKSGEPVTMTLGEMVEAVDGIDTSGITPTGNIDITEAGTIDVTEYATATVTELPSESALVGFGRWYTTENGQRKWKAQGSFQNADGTGYLVPALGMYSGDVESFNAIPTNTSVTPTESSKTIGGANTMMEGAVIVNAIPNNYVGSGIARQTSLNGFEEDGSYFVEGLPGYYTSYVDHEVPSGTAGTPTATKGTVSNHAVSITPSVTNTTGYITGGTINGTAVSVSASELVSGTYTVDSSGTKDVTNYASASVPSGTAGTPSASKGSVSNHAISVTPSVTNTTGWITGSTKTGTAVSVSASELVSGTYTVTSAGTKDVTNYASASIASGTEGTPSATKGTVSNHSVTVTPSVTNTAGWISGGTKTGTGVTVSASELVSGSDTVTQNDTYDVTNLAELVVNVSGGGSTGVAVGTKTTTLASTSSSISFTGLLGNPTSFVVTSSVEQSTGGTKVVVVAYDGSSLHGMDVTTQAEADTGFTKSYNGGALTITATSASFQANEYKLVYTYGGSSSDIHTADVQVGSGATSITFSGLHGRPVYFSCVFKSDFGTSSGYQRVIDVVNDGTSTYGHAMDSSAHYSNAYWSYTYSGGSLTISSQGTNQGGYFHQPGYYQLTYAVDDSAPSYQTKTGIGATTTSQTITADSGYDALESVQINPVSQTNLVAGNIKSGTTISISNGLTNIWSVTGTYTGGGGSSTCKTTTITNSNDQATSIQFTELSGEPKWFFVRLTSQLTRSSSYSYYYVTAVSYNGTTHTGNYYRRSNGTFYNDTTHYSHTYSNGTLTVSSSASRGAAGGSFYNGGYELVYIY